VSGERSRARDVDGLVLLDKPRGVTSNRALQRVKRLFQAAKAGHTGSLDPLATGMLPICFGAATKLARYLLDAPKTYRVRAQLGVATDTGDAEGSIVEERAAPRPNEVEIAQALATFIGEIEQVPPMYSALKQGGVPLYRLARRGIEVPRKARKVAIHSIALEAYRWPDLELTVACSKGTYIRTLVTDIAATLGTVAHVAALRRLTLGPFSERELRTLEELEARAADGGLAALDAELLPLDSVLIAWPRVVLDPKLAERLMHGQAVPADPAWPRGTARVYAAPMQFVAIAEITPENEVVPKRVFRYNAALR
jgi:tRNA pseudouridine55 synthase